MGARERHHMNTTALRPRHVPSSTVWTIRVGRETYRVRTSSARAALRFAKSKGGRDPIIVGLEVETSTPASSTTPRIPATRFDRLRKALLPDALRRRDAGESVTEIAAALKVPRETLRDWLLLAGAA